MSTQPSIVSATGIELVDTAGHTIIDLAAALASCLGHRHPDVVAAITAACQSDLGAGFTPADPLHLVSLGEPFSDFRFAQVVASASEANECAIRIARLAGQSSVAEGGGGDGGASDRFRIVTVLGGYHGDTLACRSAGGRFEDQAANLPLAPGFRHVAAGDARAIAKAVDGQTAAVLIAPVDWAAGGEPFSADYLRQVRQICDDAGALLIIDETRLPLAISGRWFFHQSAEIAADVVTASAGWTGGLAGGLVLVSESVPAGAIVSSQNRSGEDSAKNARNAATLLPPAGESALPQSDVTVLREIVAATAQAVRKMGGPESVTPEAARWAEHWDALAEGFEFVDRVSTLGLWAMVRFDLPSIDVQNAAAAESIRLLRSGETSLVACLPMMTTMKNAEEMIFGRLRQALETIERQTI
jgi:acetylornithine/succinyldiaminopimelate/putrescine aminotransferase